MNKSEFVERMQEKGSYKTKIEAEKALNAFLGALEESLAAKETVSFMGFGTFDTRLSKGKSGKIPGSDKTYTSEDRYIPRFKAGKVLKDRVAAGQ